MYCVSLSPPFPTPRQSQPPKTPALVSTAAATLEKASAHNVVVVVGGVLCVHAKVETFHQQYQRGESKVNCKHIRVEIVSA